MRSSSSNNHRLELVEPVERRNLRGGIELCRRNPSLSLALQNLCPGNLGPRFEFRGVLDHVAAKSQHHAEIVDLQKIRGRTGGSPLGLLPEFPGPIVGLEHHPFEFMFIPLWAPYRVENEDLIEPADQGVTDLQLRRADHRHPETDRGVIAPGRNSPAHLRARRRAGRPPAPARTSSAGLLGRRRCPASEIPSCA